MRIKYMYYLLKENFKALECLSLGDETYKIGGINEKRGTVENWQSAKNALETVSVIPFLNNFSNYILTHSEFRSDIIQERDSFVISYGTYKDIYPKYNNFLEQIRGVIAFCEDAGFNINEQGFDVKMPPTDDLNDFANNLALLNKVFSQCPYLIKDNEKIILKNTDIGSIWFEFCVIATGSTVLLLNLAKIVDKCIKIKSHAVIVKQQEELLRAAKLKNEILETVVEANKQAMGAIVSECVEELKNEIPETKLNPEDEERVKFSLNTISTLMGKGMEIYASIDSPKEIKDIFPSSDEISSLPDTRKAIEE